MNYVVNLPIYLIFYFDLELFLQTMAKLLKHTGIKSLFLVKVNIICVFFSYPLEVCATSTSKFFQHPISTVCFTDLVKLSLLMVV